MRNTLSLSKPLEAKTIAALRQSHEHGVLPDQAIRDYILTLNKANLSIGECVDFFCVDTLSIAELAGYADDEQRCAVDCFDSINNELASQFFK